LVCEPTCRTPHAVRRAPRNLTHSVAASGFLSPSTRRNCCCGPESANRLRETSLSSWYRSGRPSSTESRAVDEGQPREVQTDRTARCFEFWEALVNLSATAMSRPARSVRRTVPPASMCYREAALASSGRRSLALRLPNRRSRTSSPRVPPRIALALIQAEVDLDPATALRTLEPLRPGSVYAGRHSLTHTGRRHGPAQGWYSRVIGGRT
jgi:hypothetical protein